jgi:NitT/TauT family transport system substrate-binding protein
MARIATALALVTILSVPIESTHAEPITVSQYGRLATTLPWAIALKKGMLKEAGLDIDRILSTLGGGTGLRAMMATQVQFAVITAPTAVAGVKAGFNIKVVGCEANHIGDLAWVAKAGSGVNTLDDLVGKKVGFSNPKSFTEMVIRVVLQRKGLKDKVELLSTGGLSGGLIALEHGEIAAAPEIEPGLTKNAAKHKVLFYARDVLPEFAMSFAVAGGDYADKNPETIRKLIAVQKRAVDFIYANPADAEKIYAEVWKTEPAEAHREFQQFLSWRIWAGGKCSKAGLDALSASLQEIGDVDRPVDWPNLIDQRFLEPEQRIPL